MTIEGTGDFFINLQPKKGEKKRYLHFQQTDGGIFCDLTVEDETGYVKWQVLIADSEKVVGQGWVTPDV